MTRRTLFDRLAALEAAPAPGRVTPEQMAAMTDAELVGLLGLPPRDRATVAAWLRADHAMGDADRERAEAIMTNLANGTVQ